MHPLRVAITLAVLMSALASSESVHAQTEGDDVHVRNQCRLAAQVLRTGHPAPHREWALDYIWRCEASGAPVLAALWRQSPTEPDNVDRLFLSSYRLRDARLSDALVEIAADRSVPQIVRLNAIRVLAGHAVPEFLITISDLVRPVSSTARASFPSVDHVTVRNGDMRVGTATITAIIQAMERIADDPDPQVSLAASRTHRQLCLRLESCR